MVILNAPKLTYYRKYFRKNVFHGRQFWQFKQFRHFKQFRQFSRHAPKLTYYRKTKRTIAIQIAIISQEVSAV